VPALLIAYQLPCSSGPSGNHLLNTSVSTLSALGARSSANSPHSLLYEPTYSTLGRHQTMGAEKGEEQKNPSAALLAFFSLQ
jgi:hypothetical protein